MKIPGTIHSQIDDLVLENMEEEVELLRAATTKDEHGYETKTWSVLDTVKATVRLQSGREAVEADRVASQQAGTAKIPYRSDLTTSDRVRFNGDDFAITGLRDLQNTGQILELTIQRL